MPTLLAMAGVEAPPSIAFDGIDVLDVLRGEKDKAKTKRFWQWNRYTPIGTCNAAIRDGAWKLIRPGPAWDELVWISEEDAAADQRFREDPEAIQAMKDICRDPEPERKIPAPSAPLLFNLDQDPYEQNDLSASHQQRARKMQLELENWFESVETERRSISKDN